MFTLLKKILPKNIAGLLGILQVIVPLIRELVMVIIRFFAVFMPGKVDDKLVAKVKSGCDKIEGGFDAVKGFLLGL